MTSAACWGAQQQEGRLWPRCSHRDAQHLLPLGHLTIAAQSQGGHGTLFETGLGIHCANTGKLRLYQLSKHPIQQGDIRAV